jgi:hypothetical protein
MNIEEIKNEAEFLKNIDIESEDYYILGKIFSGFEIGQIGYITRISKSELELHNEDNNKKDIEYLKMTDKFITIPFPDDCEIKNDGFLIFIMSDATGGEGRPEYRNMVIPMSYFLKQSKDYIYQTKKV